MIKLTQLLNELEINNPIKLNNNTAKYSIIKLLKHFNINWENPDNSYDIPLDQIDKRLKNFLEDLEWTENYEFEMNNRVVSTWIVTDGLTDEKVVEIIIY